MQGVGELPFHEYLFLQVVAKDAQGEEEAVHPLLAWVVSDPQADHDTVFFQPLGQYQLACFCCRHGSPSCTRTSYRPHHSSATSGCCPRTWPLVSSGRAQTGTRKALPLAARACRGENRDDEAVRLCRAGEHSGAGGCVTTGPEGRG